MDVIAQDSDGGSTWLFNFEDGLVTQLRIDYRFTLLLQDGTNVVIEQPFELSRDGRPTLVPPGEVPYEVADALPLFNRRVERAASTPRGGLLVAFDDGTTLDVPSHAHYESWQVVAPDGSQWIGAPDGQVVNVGAPQLPIRAPAGALDIGHHALVSRDLIVQDMPADARSVADIADDWVPEKLPFGRQAVVDAVLAIAPSADFADPNWGRIDLPGLAIEVSVSDDEPLTSFAFHVRASDQATADHFLRAILNRLGVRAFDSWSDSGIFE